MGYEPLPLPPLPSPLPGSAKLELFRFWRLAAVSLAIYLFTLDLSLAHGHTALLVQRVVLLAALDDALGLVIGPIARLGPLFRGHAISSVGLCCPSGRASPAASRAVPRRCR